MDQAFTQVRVLIWDFDGTLFRPQEAFNRVIIEADYQVIMNHTGWTREKTIEEFHKIYKVQTPSSTETAAKLAGIPVAEAAIECEEYKDRTSFISRDDQLIMLFESLKSYTHYMLANGIKNKLVAALRVLGVPVNTFKEIVTSEIVGVNKPQPHGFMYIMNKSKQPPHAHLMIGDREAVDLAPAKALGMKTCHVWQKTSGNVADITLPNVYDLAGVLL